MRKWHRWLSVLFGLLILFVAVTGVMSHFTAIVADGERPVQAAVPSGFACPDIMICRPKPTPDGARSWVGYLHHLHSGEEFGPVGTALSISSGLALIFFALSGLCMYLQMFRVRTSKAQGRGGRFFW